MRNSRRRLRWSETETHGLISGGVGILLYAVTAMKRMLLKNYLKS